MPRCTPQFQPRSNKPYTQRIHRRALTRFAGGTRAGLERLAVPDGLDDRVRVRSQRCRTRGVRRRTGMGRGCAARVRFGHGGHGAVGRRGARALVAGAPEVATRHAATLEVAAATMTSTEADYIKASRCRGPGRQCRAARACNVDSAIAPQPRRVASDLPVGSPSFGDVLPATTSRSGGGSRAGHRRCFGGGVDARRLTHLGGAIGNQAEARAPRVGAQQVHNRCPTLGQRKPTANVGETSDAALRRTNRAACR